MTPEDFLLKGLVKSHAYANKPIPEFKRRALSHHCRNCVLQNKNISSFWVNGAFYQKIKSCAPIGTADSRMRFLSGLILCCKIFMYVGTMVIWIHGRVQSVLNISIGLPAFDKKCGLALIEMDLKVFINCFWFESTHSWIYVRNNNFVDNNTRID